MIIIANMSTFTLWLFALFLCATKVEQGAAFIASRSFAFRPRMVTPLSVRTVFSKPNFATEGDGPEDEQFLGWAGEEIEIQKQERLQRIKEIEDDGEYVPAYLRAVYDSFDVVTVEEETPASKLPIIAVVGRPNTGKSTIVNRLTQSFKVSSST